jgi:Leucine-rich repeat (LRR) protein
MKIKLLIQKENVKMKNITLLICFIIFTQLLNSQVVNIPDNNFKAALLSNSSINTNGDGEIQVSEAQATTYIYVSSLNISDLTGIEFFINLTELFCSNNNITNLDFSSNTNLTILDCLDNNLTSLNLSNNSKLEELICGNNPLNVLDLTNNINLTSLNSRNNGLTNIDLSNNTALKSLVCIDDQLTNLDLSNNINLTFLACINNKLTNLNISNSIELKRIFCYNNELTDLDISNNVNIEWLDFSNNFLSDINVVNNINLTSFSCNGNQLSSLDVSSNISLTYFNCSSNKLVDLDVRNGNNNLLTGFYSQNNTDLKCILVDDKNFSTCNWTDIDATSNFVETEAECTSLSIEQFDKLNYSIFPNPTHSKLNIKTSLPIKKVTVYNSLGKNIKQSSNVILDIENLPNGIYLLNIELVNSINIKRKFIKK